ncbi:PAS domain-containing protein [uncultured Sphingomonas sp.]|uniref:PAS domain-containing protein n=1 Tax=uncultured Sphingomonas sp. TaxID=158754 RepID=UPI0025E1577E|nr:PAS domain-containing protein [uncultured Sphingomonas sp.]
MRVTDRPAESMSLRFLDHGGEMGRRIRDRDWSRTPLGPIDAWPATLRTMLGVALSSSHPTCVYWGPEMRLLYNDAWSVIPAERHPGCLGEPAAEVWQDIWHVVGPEFAQVMATGESIAAYDQPLAFLRDGVPVDTFFNYSLSPIRDETGEIVGIFNQGNETTRLVMAERESAREVGRLRELFHQAPSAVALLHGPDFVFDFANDAYSVLVGHRDIIGKTLVEALPEVVGTGFDALLRQVWDTGEPYRAHAAPVPIFAAGGGLGEIRQLDFVYQPIRGVDGQVTDIFVQANDVTDRARAEEALRESEERLQLALSSSLSIGTWDWDVVADRITADERFARLYGVDPKLAAAGASIDKFFGGIHSDDLPRVQAGIEATLKTGAPFVEEYRLVRTGGTIRWVVAQGRAQFDAEGRAVRFPGVSFDITTRRTAEEAARDAARELRAATEAQDFLYRLNDQMRRLGLADEIKALASAALGRRLGADRVGFVRVDGDTVHFDSCWTNDAMQPLTGTLPLGKLGTKALAAYRNGDTRVVVDHVAERRELHADEQMNVDAGAGVGVPLLRYGRWVAGLYVNQDRPRHWSADEISLIEAVAEAAWDAVDRANAVAALAESEAKFRAIANSIDQMVWSTTPDGLHDYFNERWYDFTGVPHGSTDGEGWAGIFHPDDQARAWESWNRSLATGEPYRIEYRLRHRTGAYRWVLGSALPVRDAGGRIVRWFGTCTDIQEIVEAREVLARSRADLETAVVERTEQLMATEAQLRQAQKMEAVGQLTGGIAHDFNNMLAVVIGALDLLERRVAQGRTDVGRYVEAARDGATRAAALTQRLLSFSRQTALAPVPTDLGLLVDGMTELLDRTLGEGIQVETQLAADVWAARTDRGQLENALVNLAVNARDAMPRGGRLTIATGNRAIDSAEAATMDMMPGDYVMISVSDTGVGMDSETAARAFDPFFTTKSVGKGTGLGLSQVFGFVRQSGGHITLDTTVGVGTCITILLPRDASGRVPTAPTPSNVEAPRARNGEAVLVVEDEARVRNFSIEALEELGYRVIGAPDGPSALRLIDDGLAPDLLFTDMVMPEMSGRELANAARARHPDMRVLFTSGYTREESETLDPQVLRKPFDVLTLAMRVRQALDAGALVG